MGIPGEKTKFFIMSQPGLTAIECAPTQTKPARVKSFLSALGVDFVGIAAISHCPVY